MSPRWGLFNSWLLSFYQIVAPMGLVQFLNILVLTKCRPDGAYSIHDYFHSTIMSPRWGLFNSWLLSFYYHIVAPMGLIQFMITFILPNCRPDGACSILEYSCSNKMSPRWGLFNSWLLSFYHNVATMGLDEFQKCLDMNIMSNWKRLKNIMN